MESCKECLFFKKEYSDFIAQYEDSTAEKENMKSHFCQIYSDGIPNEIWNGKVECKRKYINEQPSE